MFQVEVFWVVTPCNVVAYRRFEGSCYLLRWYATTALHGLKMEAAVSSETSVSYHITTLSEDPTITIFSVTIQENLT